MKKKSKALKFSSIVSLITTIALLASCNKNPEFSSIVSEKFNSSTNLFGRDDEPSYVEVYVVKSK
jgi:hypothetical protein